MERNFTEQALILTSRQAGEDNRIITLLGPNRGVFEAMLYGGRKSRLRSLVSPWHSGIVWLYSDESKRTIKITDFDPKFFRQSLRENLYKNMAASVATELVIKTKAAGENYDSWVLLCGFLDGLEFSDENACKTGLLRFLWRYLGLLGIRPDSEHCILCGKNITEKNSEKDNVFQYSPAVGGFLCSECFHEKEFEINFQALEYLNAIVTKKSSDSRKMPLSNNSYDQLRRFIFFLISNATEGQLKSLETAFQIL